MTSFFTFPDDFAVSKRSQVGIYVAAHGGFLFTTPPVLPVLFTSRPTDHMPVNDGAIYKCNGVVSFPSRRRLSPITLTLYELDGSNGEPNNPGDHHSVSSNANRPD